MKLNIKSLQKATHNADKLVDNSVLYAYLMRQSGATYTDIGEVLGISRQRAYQLVKKAEKQL